MSDTSADIQKLMAGFIGLEHKLDKLAGKDKSSLIKSKFYCKCCKTGSEPLLIFTVNQKRCKNISKDHMTRFPESGEFGRISRNQSLELHPGKLLIMFLTAL